MKKQPEFSLDVNILNIDKYIREKLFKAVSHVPELKNEIRVYEFIIDRSSDPLCRLHAKYMLRCLLTRIQDIETTFEFGYYVLCTFDILEKYRNISNSKQSFVHHIGEDEKRLQAEMLRNYIFSVKDFIDYLGLKIQSSVVSHACTYCGSGLSVMDNETPVCAMCGTVSEIVGDAPTFKDSDRINTLAKYTYTKRGHFVDALNRFQGKQTSKIESRVLETLRKEISFHALTPQTISKDHIYMFLSENKLSGYYDDINLLYGILTGKQANDLSKYETELMSLFDKQEEIYEKIKPPERANSLIVNYKLFKLLQLVGYPCKKDDFYILKTRQKLEEHDEIWKKICKSLGWKFIDS